MKGQGLMHTIVTQPCMKCGKSSIVEITSKEYQRFYVQHEFLQDVFAHWTPDQRELLLTGTHPRCWDAMFAEDDIDDGSADDLPGSPPNDDGGIDSGKANIQGPIVW